MTQTGRELIASITDLFNDPRTKANPVAYHRFGGFLWVLHMRIRPEDMDKEVPDSVWCAWVDEFVGPISS